MQHFTHQCVTNNSICCVFILNSLINECLSWDQWFWVNGRLQQQLLSYQENYLKSDLLCLMKPKLQGEYLNI